MSELKAYPYETLMDGQWGPNAPAFYNIHRTVGEYPLQMREVFMMALMDVLTDQPEWSQDVFNEANVAKWRKVAMEQSERGLYNEIVSKEGDSRDSGDSSRYYPQYPPGQGRIMSGAAFDFCIQEFRAKAVYFERTGLVPTLDTDPLDNGLFGIPPVVETPCPRIVAKSDCLVMPELHAQLVATLEGIRLSQVDSGTVDWHPGSDDMVHNIVHPSLYPLTYARSPFFQDEVVGGADAVEKWAGKGTAAPKLPNGRFRTTGLGRKDWSDTYQWLPSNLAIKDKGSVQFTSYINNLHPRKHGHLYRLIKELIDAAIPAWDLALGEWG
ncbi:hypothetical protein PG994_006796 [Apiospora phragmitis]|uniref:Uncharacterized protein n=1 Tax=Apiospora phragmitis TaxID=2905665 RepID=A0ABR1VG35_9PEZI